MTPIHYTIPVRLESEANVASHGHWGRRKDRAAAQAKATRDAILATGILAPCWRTLGITMTRVAPRALDDDNLVGSFKHVRDALAATIGLRGDRDPQVRWSYQQRRGRVGEYACEIEIHIDPT